MREEDEKDDDNEPLRIWESKSPKCSFSVGKDTDSLWDTRHFLKSTSVHEAEGCWLVLWTKKYPIDFALQKPVNEVKDIITKKMENDFYHHLIWLKTLSRKKHSTELQLKDKNNKG